MFRVRKIFVLFTLLIIIVFSLISCEKDDGPVEIIDVLSTNNTTVQVTFSRPLSDDAKNAFHYKITRPGYDDQKGWHALLDIIDVDLRDDGLSILLTTSPQSAVTYQMEVLGIRDTNGNPLNPLLGEEILFVGTAPFMLRDLDGDGLSDADEQYGWTVPVVLQDGSKMSREVNSDANNPDSDGDNLTDNEERAHTTNPRSADTDGDGLSDDLEIHMYLSNPLYTDTDEDGIGDGDETLMFLTSPVLMDTDGDGADDFQEIMTGGRNPRLAEMPQLSLELYGDPLIELDYNIEQNKYSESQKLSRDEQEQVDTDNVSTKMSIENTVSLHTEVEVGTSQWPPSASAKMTTDTEFHHGYFHDTSSNWTQSSVEESQEKFTSDEISSISYADGKLSVAMKIVNLSELSFKVKDLRVMAYRLERGGKFSIIGTMSPDTTGWPDGEFILGPGGDFTMEVQREHIGAEIMLALFNNPTAMLFEVGSYSIFMLDDFGVEETMNLAKLGENVGHKTGLIVIDYGNGDVERYMVATNLRRKENGSGYGVTLKESLSDIIGLDYEVCEQIDPKTGSVNQSVLCRIGNVSTFKCDEETFEAGQIPSVCIDQINPAIKGFWTVAGTGAIFDQEDIGDFEDIILESGQQIRLVFLKDSDGDGIFDREEYLLGTNKFDIDTDKDGLSDYEESKIGWQIDVAGKPPYQVFPDPRFADWDGDLLDDWDELNEGTDPFLEDTDSDDTSDVSDQNPLAGECLKGDMYNLNLSAWWDGSYEKSENEYLAVDVWNKDSTVKGKIHGYDLETEPVKSIEDDNAFLLNQGIDQRTRFIDVPSNETISPTYEHTIAVRVYWEGLASGADQATLLTKGSTDTATYALYITKEGKIKYSIYRHYKRKCWSAGVDSWCKDYERNEKVDCVSDVGIVPREWAVIAATFGDDWMRIYINGEFAGDERTYESSNSVRKWTLSLVQNTDVLRVGCDLQTPAQWPFLGLMDDIQIFHTALNAEQIENLYHMGICEIEN
jgi:hypothetical protein